MNRPVDSPIVVLASRLLTPLIQVFALYVIFHGHYSPGGGFQGGVMFGASILLMRLAVGNAVGEVQFRSSWGTALGALGLFIYAGTGVVSMIMGGHFLDYQFLPMPWLDVADRRSMGILIVEVGVGFSVMATMASIFDDLMEKKQHD
jgi:multicomponent Na+:H+ antiporter subunit B